MSRDSGQEAVAFAAVKDIIDPEKKATLAELGIVREEFIHAVPDMLTIGIRPTLPTCGEIKLIGLCVWNEVLRGRQPGRQRVQVMVLPHSHNEWQDVNKQLADKERVLAALESDAVRSAIDRLCPG